MNNKAVLHDPTADFIEAIRQDCGVRGLEMAKKLFSSCGWDDDVMRITGKVFGEIIAGMVVGSIGNSLYDVPMQKC